MKNKRSAGPRMLGRLLFLSCLILCQLTEVVSSEHDDVTRLTKSVKSTKSPTVAKSIKKGSTTTGPPTVNGDCLNSPDYKYDNEGHNCQWVGNKENRRKSICLEPEVRDNCPQTCGICCDDSSTYKFQHQSGQMKFCRWLGKDKSRQDEYCSSYSNGEKVKNMCPLACNLCKEFIPLVTLSPTTSKSESQTSEPTTTEVLSKPPAPGPTISSTKEPTPVPTAKPTLKAPSKPGSRL